MNLSSCPESEASRRPRKKSRRKLAAANQAAQTQLCCFSVIHQWKAAGEGGGVCVDAPNRPSTRTGLLLFRLEVGHLPSATHWPRAAGGRQRPLGAVCSQKTLLSAFLAVKNTHITLFLCELRVCEERDTTAERAIIKSWRRSDDKVTAADHLSPTLLKV